MTVPNGNEETLQNIYELVTLIRNEMITEPPKQDRSGCLFFGGDILYVWLRLLHM